MFRWKAEKTNYSITDFQDLFVQNRTEDSFDNLCETFEEDLRKVYSDFKKKKHTGDISTVSFISGMNTNECSHQDIKRFVKHVLTQGWTVLVKLIPHTAEVGTQSTYQWIYDYQSFLKILLFDKDTKTYYKVSRIEVYINTVKPTK